MGWVWEIILAYTSIILEKRGHVALITLNRPQHANAIHVPMALEIEGACQEIRQDREIQVVIISGMGGTFCSGGEGEAAPSQVPGMVAALEQPVIAAIDGPALELGLALALACDIRLASEKALFGVPDIMAGPTPLSGLTQRLPRLVGRGKALEMLLTGEIVDAPEAYRLGLVSRVVAPAKLMAEAEAWAEKMAGRAPLSLRFAKEAILKGLDLTLEQGLGLEADLYFLLHTTHDRTEGITAFREKRPPRFRGE